MHAIFSVAGYSFRAANQTLFWFVFLIHKPCHTLKKVSGMWRMRKTSQNRHWQFCRGRGSAGDFFFFSTCVHMYESVILTSHTSLCWLCMCVCRYGLSLGICISTCMHSAQDLCQPIIEEICMRGVSPLPLQTARQAMPRTSCLDWHPHLLRRLPLSFPSLPMAPYSYPVHTTVKERAT